MYLCISGTEMTLNTYFYFILVAHWPLLPGFCNCMAQHLRVLSWEPGLVIAQLNVLMMLGHS